MRKMSLKCFKVVMYGVLEKHLYLWKGSFKALKKKNAMTL